MSYTMDHDRLFKELLTTFFVEFLELLLHKRVGAPDPDVEGRTAELTVEQLEALAEALLDFASPSDLDAWLDELRKAT